MTTMTGTPYAIAVGQILMTRMEVVAESPLSINQGLTLSRLSSMPAPELLSRLLGESDDVWVMAARDILSRAQIRSKTIAKATNAAATYNGQLTEAVEGPDIVRRALDVWGNGATPEDKRSHISGVRIFLETSLEAALKESPKTTIAPPRSLSGAMPAVRIPAAISVAAPLGALPPVLEGGLPVLRKLLACKPSRREEFDAYAKDFMRAQPWPIAMARMMGGDKMGQFVAVNDALLDRYRWRGNETALLKMSLLDWYHPDDRSVYTKVMFGLANAFLGKAPEFKPQSVRGLSGDVLEFRKRHPVATIPDEYYIDYQGAGVYMFAHGVTAFGIFTELPSK